MVFGCNASLGSGKVYIVVSCERQHETVHWVMSRGSYLEVEDDGPDEAEGEFGVAVHNVLSSDVDQLDLLVS